MTAAQLRAERVPVGEISLNYQELGKGPPILFLSGLGYASWSWLDVMRLLAPQWRTLALDNRGTGRSDKPPGPYSMELFADDTAAVIEALKLPYVHLVGTSMGGYIALQLVLRHPHLVRSLVLVNTSKGGPGTLPVPVSTREAWREASHLSSREFAEKTMPLSYRPGWSEENPERFRAILERRLEFPTPPASWAAQYAACEQFLITGVEVGEIHKPALVVHGTDDRIVPYENGAKLVAALPNARFLTLQGGGHLPFLEDPEGFAKIIGDFFSEQERPGRGVA